MRRVYYFTLMTFQTFILKLNWRQILVHIIATWFFMYAFQILSCLHHINLLDIVREPNDQLRSQLLRKNGTDASDLTYFSLITSISSMIGLITAFIVSFTISLKQHWFWVNSVLVLVIAYSLSWVDFSAWSFLKNIFLTPGEIFSNTYLKFLFNEIILLTFGLLFFYFKKINQFINNNYKAENI